jgi:hypothetical protein
MIESLHANDGRNNMGIFASVGWCGFRVAFASRPARTRRERALAAKSDRGETRPTLPLCGRAL